MGVTVVDRRMLFSSPSEFCTTEMEILFIEKEAADDPIMASCI
jgi:hypothetical protein